MHNSTTTAGIDTAKAKLDVALDDDRAAWRVDNTPEGWRQLARQLGEVRVRRIGIEASGGYETGVVAHLRGEGFEVVVLQPLQVKAYARLHLKRAKNDLIDARLIAACANALAEAHTPPDPRLAEIARHLTFVEQIEEDIARLKVRLEHIADARLRRYATADLGRLKLRRAAELARIGERLRAHADLANRLALVASVPGIGERTAIAVVVRLPEIGTVSREEIAALAGLAPFDDDSGKRKGIRRIAGGRARVRRSLYAAALAAAFHWNKALGDLYRRLIARGKPHKQALVACARKLIVFANTVVARGTPWVERTAEI